MPVIEETLPKAAGDPSFEKFQEVFEAYAHNEQGEPRYKVLDLLGSGGNAVTYLVEDNNLGINLVAKVRRLDEFRGEKATMDPLYELQDEAIKLAGLGSHPNIVQPYDYVEFEGHGILLMEYCEGGTLLEFMGERGWLGDRQLVVNFLEQMASGIDHVHSHNLAHRDIKPGNFFLKQGTLKLGDMGTAALFGSTNFAGTPAYLPPEVVYGNPYMQQGDVFSLGVIAAELISGHGIWKGMEALEKLHDKTHTLDPALLGDDLKLGISEKKERYDKRYVSMTKRLNHTYIENMICKKLNITWEQFEKLDLVLARAMDWEPAERYKSAKEFVDALKSVF